MSQSKDEAHCAERAGCGAMPVGYCALRVLKKRMDIGFQDDIPHRVERRGASAPTRRRKSSLIGGEIYSVMTVAAAVRTAVQD